MVDGGRENVESTLVAYLGEMRGRGCLELRANPWASASTLSSDAV